MFIPLANNPEETFSLSIISVIYNFRTTWNTLGFWTIDIRQADYIPIVLGVKIITKEFILKQFPDIPFDLLGANESDPVRNTLDTFNLEVIEKDV